MIRKLHIIFSAICIIFLAGSLALCDTTINLKEKAYTEGPLIKLSDISTISYTNQPSHNNFSGIENILFGKAPADGCIKVITKSSVIVELKKNQVDLSIVKIIGANEVQVVRNVPDKTNAEINPEDLLLDIFTKRLYEDNIDNGYSSIKAYIIKIESFDSEAFTAENVVIADIKGKIPGAVVIRFALKPDETLYTALLSVKCLKKVIVASTAIRARSTITGRNIKFEDREVTPGTSNAITKLSEIINGKALVGISKGEIITSSMIKSPPVIRKRDDVTIYIRTNNFRLDIRGEAIEDGSIGDLIKVRNESSGKIIYGRVLKQGIVLFEYNS